MNQPSGATEIRLAPNKTGTLAIDFGNTTTVVAFQENGSFEPVLLDLPPISKRPGEIPTLLWQNKNEAKKYLIGQQVFDRGLARTENPSLSRDFKKWIGTSEIAPNHNSELSPQESGELIIHEIWNRIPKHITIQRLVLTSPVESYRNYRSWLHKVCSSFPVEEIALVDEPTAAAMGAGLVPGSKILVLDIGGSTIDLSVVALEGGEGKARPIAQLMRFGGQDLEGKSHQILRCAKVLGKAGMMLGGRDIDRWIANCIFPKTKLTEPLLDAAEKLKCKLSNKLINENKEIIEHFSSVNSGLNDRLILCRRDLEKLLIEKGFLGSLNSLLKEVLASASRNNCSLNDLQAIVAVGGGAQIPLVQRWLMEKTKPIPLLTPPPIEAVAIGALKLTPGTEVKDVLNHGVYLRCWNRRTKKYIWHPLFLAGQTWPTSSPLELILSASKDNQLELDLVLAEPLLKGSQNIIYLNGIPTIQEELIEPKFIEWDYIPKPIKLDPPGQIGEDCLLLRFDINEQALLEVEGKDLRTQEQIQKIQLGPVR